MGAGASQCSNGQCACCQSEPAEGAEKMVEVQESITPGIALPGAEPTAPVREDSGNEERLKSLLRQFAHAAVGPGLTVKSRIITAEGDDSEVKDSVHSLLKMDRRITCLELWPISKKKRNAAGEPLISMPFQKVQSFGKSSSKFDKINGHDCLLTVFLQNGPRVNILFDTMKARDDAHTCLRIFQVSSAQQRLEENSTNGQSDISTAATRE